MVWIMKELYLQFLSGRNIQYILGHASGLTVFNKRNTASSSSTEVLSMKFFSTLIHTV